MLTGVSDEAEVCVEQIVRLLGVMKYPLGPALSGGAVLIDGQVRGEGGGRA